MSEPILTVSQLNSVIKTGLENDEYLKNIYVIGEISNLTLNKSGHIYFSIKDEASAINCMIWKDKAKTLLKLNPKEGMKITCLGRITYYVPTGRVSYEVRDVRLEGKGELQQLFDNRYKELEKLGWFDQSIKKQIPKFPKNLGIVTALTGAAIHDLITTIKRRYPLVNIFLFPAQVQGEQAQFDITNKIKQANNFKIKIDLLIVGRGGGSYEDLWSFNELSVLQAIKDSKIPIISAVGHEPDFTLADYVADIRAATPTAAGEIATPNIIELNRELGYLYKQYKSTLSRIYLQNFNNIKIITEKIIEISNYKIKNINNILINSFDQFKNNILNKLENNLQLINFQEDKIKLLDPMQPLQKGYSFLMDASGKGISTIKNINIDENIQIKLKDGTIKSIVKEVKGNK